MQSARPSTGSGGGGGGGARPAPPELLAACLLLQRELECSKPAHGICAVQDMVSGRGKVAGVSTVDAEAAGHQWGVRWASGCLRHAQKHEGGPPGAEQRECTLPTAGEREWSALCNVDVVGGSDEKTAGSCRG